MAVRMGAVSLLIACAIPLLAQTRPDIELTARVRARELFFYEVPNASVTFLVPERNATVWETQRQNLPDRVQPNVFYRDIGITLTISSTLPNIEEILNDVFGPTSSKESIDATSPADSGSTSDGDDAAGAATNDDHLDDNRGPRRADPRVGGTGSAPGHDPGSAAPPATRRNSG